MNRQIGVRDFKYLGKIFPLRTGHVIRRMLVNGGLWRTSELISQERIGVGSSNLVEGLTTWPAMFGHCPRLKGQRARSQGHVTYPHQQRCNSAMDSRINIKHGGNDQRGWLNMWHAF